MVEELLFIKISQDKYACVCIEFMNTQEYPEYPCTEGKEDGNTVNTLFFVFVFLLFFVIIYFCSSLSKQL